MWHTSTGFLKALGSASNEMTHFVGRGERDIDDHLAGVDLIITGPHASAAFPAEMQPFVDSRLTKRLQYDFTDVSTSPVTRRWAQIDPRVLYIEDPHPRAVRDANRARPDDLLPGLREAFARLRGRARGPAVPARCGRGATGHVRLSPGAAQAGDRRRVGPAHRRPRHRRRSRNRRVRTASATT